MKLVIYQGAWQSYTEVNAAADGLALLMKLLQGGVMLEDDTVPPCINRREIVEPLIYLQL
jgi:hypothetical protein